MTDGSWNHSCFWYFKQSTQILWASIFSSVKWGTNLSQISNFNYAPNSSQQTFFTKALTGLTHHDLSQNLQFRTIQYWQQAVDQGAYTRDSEYSPPPRPALPKFLPNVPWGPHMFVEQLHSAQAAEGSHSSGPWGQIYLDDRTNICVTCWDLCGRVWGGFSFSEGVCSDFTSINTKHELVRALVVCGEGIPVEKRDWVSQARGMSSLQSGGHWITDEPMVGLRRGKREGKRRASDSLSWD